MGDDLRTKLGSYSGQDEWTEKEREHYREIRRRELLPLYVAQKISNTEMPSVARFLDEFLGITNQSYEEQKALKIAEKEGKPQALLYLENLVIEKYF